MKNKTRIIVSAILLIFFIIGVIPKSEATNFVIAFSNSTANVGDTITVTITGKGIKGNVDLKVDGKATLSKTKVYINDGSASAKLKITGPGTIKITATSQSDMIETATSKQCKVSTAGNIKVGNTDKTNIEEKTAEKSSNADLKNLGIRPNDFSGFKPEKTSYEVTVPEDVEEIEVYATAKDNKAKITGTGKKKLQAGENNFLIVVTAEDETTKSYTIKVIRKTNEEDKIIENEENKNTANGLESLEIEDINLVPNFDTNIYEYKVAYIGEKTKLEINAIGTDPHYIIDIMGNEDLKEGENIITILVTDPDGENVATYQVMVNKSLVDQELIAKEKLQNKKMIIGIGTITFAIVILLIIFLIRRRRNQIIAQDYTIPYTGINNREDREDKEEKENKEEIEFTKEQARKDFLENYNVKEDNENIKETPIRKKAKGKRFK